MKSGKNFFLVHKLIVMMALLFYFYDANAVCITNGGGAAPITVNAQQPSVSVQRDMSIGTVFSSFVINASGTIASCSAGSGSESYELNMFTSLSSISNYYKTNLPGVALGIKFSGAGWYFPSVRPYDGPIAITMYPIEISLVKTGNITSGILSSGVLATSHGDDNVRAITVNFTGNRITQLACSISQTNLTFPIGDISTSTFGSSVGTIPSGAQNTQNLGLNCDAGANINVMLQGTQNPDVGTTSVLALTGQGNSDVAKGVGVQLLYNGTPLVLNNRIVLKQSAGGQETFPITARYYQTKTSVSTGKANAAATLDLTYQ